jgi:hypothetical protein
VWVFQSLRTIAALPSRCAVAGGAIRRPPRLLGKPILSCPTRGSTVFHLDDVYQLLAVAGTFADAGLALGVDRPDKQLQLSIVRTTMDEEALNTSVRKFLKKLGVTAQREIEMAVRDADAKGLLKGSNPLPAKAVVTVGGIDLKFEINGNIELG